MSGIAAIATTAIIRLRVPMRPSLWSCHVNHDARTSPKSGVVRYRRAAIRALGDRSRHGNHYRLSRQRAIKAAARPDAPISSPPMILASRLNLPDRTKGLLFDLDGVIVDTL